MAKVLLPLADGCEELEAVTIIDMLRRAEIEVVAAGLKEGPVRASRGVTLVPDMTLHAALARGGFDAVVLPGGMGGTHALAADARVAALLKELATAGKTVAAICAAPLVLAKAGLLTGRRFTAYPGVLTDADAGGTQTGAAVEVDGNLVTSRGPGTAMDFSLTLVDVLRGRKTREEVEAGLVR